MAADTMPAASETPASLEGLIRGIVEGERGERAQALLRAIRAGMADVLVADYACGQIGDPVVLTLRGLFKHVCAEDHLVKVARRGYRMHSTINVVPWDEDQGGHGPGLKRGPA
ncbi:MAG: hypothetical protein JO222_01410 [Frankiales bacterium]|nr:hypothetical protein [Frankiales bacterium]